MCSEQFAHGVPDYLSIQLFGHLGDELTTTAISSSVMADRQHDKSTILRGWVTLRRNFRLKGYNSRLYLRTIRWGNVYTTILLLEVFTQRNFVADYI